MLAFRGEFFRRSCHALRPAVAQPMRLADVMLPIQVAVPLNKGLPNVLPGCHDAGKNPYLSPSPLVAPPDLGAPAVEGGVQEIILPAPKIDEQLEEGPEGSDPAPLLCNQFWYRITKNQRNALKPVENASRADCGPRKKHWRWYRDRRIAMRKKKRFI
eukprot:TRINITY_DN53571_c0_g1_i1.p2 TRINITY_DN53571_c0_g1~~TRINITY_DN53571_c0_g1_i1.p2  ORF type:complete len:158 (+),score=25.89 TRINITY_DN53571_c0_g1_i1:70-543(+)